MNTPRAVLQCPPTGLSSSSLLAKQIRMLCASICLTTTPLFADGNTAIPDEKILSDVPGEVLAQTFEGFTSKLTYDAEHSTWNIGYGTDIGQKKSIWPYGTYAQDIAEYMQKKGYSTETIRDILQGKETLTQELAKELFDLRYERRKQMLVTRYEELYAKKFTDLPDVVQKMLVDFSYNMRGEYGILPGPGFPGFPAACKALKEEDWAKFAHEIAESTYADQVGPRRAGYWVYQLVKLSEKPLTAMTRDVKEEVKDFKGVQEEVEIKIAKLMR